MDKVKIAVSGKGNLANYVNSLEGVGAVTVSDYPIAFSEEYDGLLLTGGADVHPRFYNEEVDGSVGMDTERDETEMALIKAFLDAGKPVMGICRGHQLINVYFGGSLHQHIAEADLHRGGGKVHFVDAAPDSAVGSLYGTRFCVNSTHHQAVKRLGDGLRATAVWEDKYVEATEHKSLPVLTMQWHPECMCFERKREDTVDGAAVFGYFVELCRKNRP